MDKIEDAFLSAIAPETFLVPLREDIDQCGALLSKSDSQFARRMFVRANFAYFEAHLFLMRQILLGLVVDTVARTGTFEFSKLAMLHEDTYTPELTGKLKSKPNYTPFLNNCAFTLRIWAETFNVDPKPFFSDNGWREMHNSVKVRHRITHPKSAKEIKIQTSEIESVKKAYRWLHEFYSAETPPHRKTLTSHKIDYVSLDMLSLY